MTIQEGQTEAKTMYAQERKEAFLQTIKKDSTRADYKLLLEKCRNFEEALKKELAEFNVAEVTSLMKTLNPSTLGNARTYGRILSSYFSWAVTMNLRKFNPLATVGREWWNQFADETVREYYSFDEIMTLADFCENPQDAIPFYLLFEGVQGKEFSEIRNLKKQDVLSGSVLRLTARTNAQGEPYHMAVHPRTIKAVEEAIKVKVYYKDNGDMDDSIPANIPRTIDLIDNDYVVRAVANRNKTYDAPAKKDLITHRIEQVRNRAGFEYRNLTAKDIVRSGMIYYAKELMMIYGEINKELLNKVAEKFNINHIWNMKEYINEEVITKLYGIDPQEVYAKVHAI